MKKIVYAAISSFVFMFCAQANAALITDSSNQTSDGQLFNFSLNGPVSDGTSGILTVTSRGDYSIGPFPGSESWDINIEGLFLQNDVVPTDGNIITEFSFDDVFWEIDFVLSGSLLSQVSADGVFNISIDLDSGVNNFNPLTASVAVALEYHTQSVPEPASIVLLGLGLVGIGFLRKKKAA